MRHVITSVCAATLIWAIATNAQILETDRRIDWSPGISGGIPVVSGPVVNVRDHGAVGNGTTNDQTAFTAAISALPVTGGVLSIPAGTYLLRTGLVIGTGVVVRGEGLGRTTILFDLAGRAEICIQIVTYGRGTWVAMRSGYQKGSSAVVVASTTGFTAGTIVETQQDNDSLLMYTDPEWIQPWALGAVGQFNRCTGVRGDTLLLERPLYMSYRSGLNPVIRKQRLVQGAGIENLRIKRRDAGDGETVMFKNAADCWVSCIEGDSTVRCHVAFESAWRCEVRRSFFHNAHNYGNGGHGYGVTVGMHVTDCLVEDNVFVQLRHAMMAHVGASGNVFGYNYSREPFSGESWTPCDISMHGHYGNYNLFEGNMVQEIDYSDFWGPMGPGNTVFRNKVEAEGIDVLDYSHRQNIIGNVLGTGMDTIFVGTGVDSTLQHGNVVRGATRWDAAIADHTLPSSLYLGAKPSFLGAATWPTFGPDIVAGAKLPAQIRWETGNHDWAPLRRKMSARHGTLQRQSKTHWFTIAGTRLAAEPRRERAVGVYVCQVRNASEERGTAVLAVRQAHR